jgi:hypothetical protein
VNVDVLMSWELFVLQSEPKLEMPSQSRDQTIPLQSVYFSNEKLKYRIYHLEHQ